MSEDAGTPGLDAPGDGPTRSVTLFSEEHHGYIPPGVPATTGVVAAVHLVRFTFEVDPVDGVSTPVPGSAQLEPVRHAARWQVDKAAGRTFAGFLVDLSFSS